MSLQKVLDRIAQNRLPNGRLASFRLAFAERAGVASEFSNVQLWNPATSAKVVEVLEVVVHAAAADSLKWGITSTEIAGSAGTIEDKVGDAYAGDVECTHATHATITQYLADAAARGRPFAAAAGMYGPLWTPRLSIFLKPGRGLTLVSQTANSIIAPTFIFQEIGAS